MLWERMFWFQSDDEANDGLGASLLHVHCCESLLRFTIEDHLFTRCWCLRWWYELLLTQSFFSLVFFGLQIEVGEAEPHGLDSPACS